MRVVPHPGSDRQNAQGIDLRTPYHIRVEPLQFDQGIRAHRRLITLTLIRTFPLARSRATESRIPPWRRVPEKPSCPPALPASRS